MYIFLSDILLFRNGFCKVVLYILLCEFGDMWLYIKFVVADKLLYPAICINLSLNLTTGSPTSSELCSCWSPVSHCFPHGPVFRYGHRFTGWDSRGFTNVGHWGHVSFVGITDTLTPESDNMYGQPWEALWSCLPQRLQ